MDQGMAALGNIGSQAHLTCRIIAAVIITIGPSNFSVFMVCLALSVNLKAAESCQAQN